MSDDPIAGLTPRDAHRIRVLLDIVRDLAVCDPVVHHEVDYGQSDAYTCGACGVEIVGDAAYRYIGDPTKFPHADTCPWKRARELQP